MAPVTTTPSVLGELLSLLICPHTGAPLSGWNGVSPGGALSAPGSDRVYLVCEGIPCLLPDELRPPGLPSSPPKLGERGGRAWELEHQFAEKLHEMAARDAQVGDYDALLGLRLLTAAELPLSIHYLRPEPDQLLLEGGCGTGRMTGAFAQRVRGLVCVDFSRESLRAARAKLTPDLRAKTLFVQADLSRLPLATGVFDRVGSFGVYEHLPTDAARNQALGHMVRTLKPRTRGGRIALSAYRWGAPQALSSKKEGHHDGGIYFLRLTWDELAERAGRHVVIGGHTGALLYYWLLWGRAPR